jgi:vitamin B12 transporter
MKAYLAAGVGAVSLSLSLSLSASDLETITVSATPVLVDDAGSSITVITREQIEAQNASIQSLLRTVPGFAVSQQGSIGAVTQVRVRGAEANQVLVLIDGIEANDLAQGSEFDFSQISLGDVERIEIVRGPQSALWGSDAMAGVIHIITRPGEFRNTISTFFEAGSFSTTRATVSANVATDQHRAKLSIDYLDTDGTNISRQGSEDDGLENLTVSLSGRYTPGSEFALEYTLRQSEKTSEFDANDFITTGLPVDADNETRSDYFYGGVSITHDISDALEHSLLFARTDTSNRTRPANDKTAGEKDKWKYQLSYTAGAHRISVIGERESESFRQRGTATFFGDPNQNRDTETTSLASEYQYVGERLNLSLSARQDNNDEFDDANAWRATVSYGFDAGSLYASVGESTKNPTFTERYGFYTNFIGNPDLKPEESLHWEVGARGDFLDKRLRLGITWFEADLTDEINGFVFDPVTFGFTSANVAGESHRQGAELTLDYQPTERLSLSASYSYLDATQEDFAGADVEEVRRPEHSGSVAINYRWQQAGLGLTVSRTGSQEDDYFPPFPPWQERVELSGFTLVELSGYYELNSKVTLSFRAENLTDEAYEEVYGFEAPGFAAYAGVRIRF